MCAIPGAGAGLNPSMGNDVYKQVTGKARPGSPEASTGPGRSAGRQAGGQIAAPVYGGGSGTILTSGDGVAAMSPTSKKTLLGQ